MQNAITIIVPLLFVGFVGLDIISIFPRVAGSILQKHGIAYSFQLITATLKRMFIVTYPPLLGIISITGSISDMYNIVLVSYVAAIFIWALIFTFRFRVVSFFCSALDAFSNGASLYGSFMMGLRNSISWLPESREIYNRADSSGAWCYGLDKSILFTASWIFFFYTATPFLINIVGMMYREYASIILQLTGISSAMGTLVLAFFLDPKLSRIYEEKNDVPAAFRSLLAAHILNLLVFGPIFFVGMAVF